jgi:hypothetical protein
MSTPSIATPTNAAWTPWREHDRVREIAALGRAPTWPTEDLDEAAAIPPTLVSYLVADATDSREAMLLTLCDAVRTTRATIALAHRVKEPHAGLVTSCVYGPGAPALLGSIVSSDGHLHASIAGRLSLAARPIPEVVMIPVRDHGSLVAMLELGRTDHMFRRDDVAAVEDLVAALLAYFDQTRKPQTDRAPAERIWL